MSKVYHFKDESGDIRMYDAEAAEKLIELGAVCFGLQTECCGAYCSEFGCCPFNKEEENERD